MNNKELMQELTKYPSTMNVYITVTDEIANILINTNNKTREEIVNNLYFYRLVGFLRSDLKFLLDRDVNAANNPACFEENNTFIEIKRVYEVINGNEEIIVLDR
jgi:hypothetical protein